MIKRYLFLIFSCIFLAVPIFCESLFRASERARALFEGGKLDESLAIYKELVTKTKDQKIKAILKYNLGTVLLKAGNFQEAVSIFYEGLSKAPEELKPRMEYNLAHSLFKCGRRDEALSILRDAISKKHDFEDAKLLYEWILKQTQPEPPPPEENEEPPPPPPMLEELPPPPPELLQDEIEDNPNPKMKPW